jgi:hypothetical protein
MQNEKIKTSISLFLLVSIILFLVALGLAGWVFLEKKLLIQKINTDKQTISTNKNSFETDTIENMIRLDSRIEIAKQIINNHVAMSPIFGFLEARTLKNIRFKNFHFSSNSGTADNSVKIDMSGQAKDFQTIASQAEEFGKVDYRSIIKNPVFSDLNLTQDGSVSFSFSANIMSDFVSYKNTRGFVAN